jgi:branched-chain amino acid transport system substrate-binding protein
MYPRILIAALAGAFALTACAGEKPPIYIAVAGPLHAANGESMRLAVQMAAAEINRSGGIGGRTLELLLEDDHAMLDSGAVISQRLARDPRVVAVVGHLNSAVSIRAADAYNGRLAGVPPVPQISPASSAPQYTQAGPWSFRVTPTDLEFAPVLAAAAAGLGLRRAAVVYVNDDYGQGVRDGFRASFAAAGGTVVSADPFLGAVLEEGDELDPYLRRAIGRGADALLLAAQAEAGVRIIRAARRLGYEGTVLGADGMTAARDAGPIAEGLFISSAFLPDRDTPQARDFVDAYRAANGGALPDHRGAMAYDAVYLLKRAIEEAGADRRGIRQWLASFTDPARAHPGVSGDIYFDENGDVQGKQPVLGVIRDGALITARR